MSSVKGELVDKLDSKTAKPGGIVVLKTRHKVATADGTVIPKGSKLVGQVSEVKPHTQSNPNAVVAIRSDRAEIKGGQSLQVQSVIESVAPPENAAAGTGIDSFGNGRGVGETMPGGSMPGAAAGAGAGGMNRSGSPAGSSASIPTVGSESTMGRSTQSGQSAGRVVGSSRGQTIRTTAIPGIYLATRESSPEAGTPAQEISGTLLAAMQEVRLDSGTEVVLGVFAAK